MHVRIALTALARLRLFAVGSAAPGRGAVAACDGSGQGRDDLLPDRRPEAGEGDHLSPGREGDLSLPCSGDTAVRARRAERAASVRGWADGRVVEKGEAEPGSDSGSGVRAKRPGRVSRSCAASVSGLRRAWCTAVSDPAPTRKRTISARLGSIAADGLVSAAERAARSCHHARSFVFRRLDWRGPRGLGEPVAVTLADLLALRSGGFRQRVDMVITQ
jgi:hypothetical protein